MQWPDSPIWDFSLRVNDNDGVPPICLGIQEGHAAGVNFLLYCAWAGEQVDRLGEGVLARIVEAVDGWHREIVVALRNRRTRLKFDALDAPPAFVDGIRSEIKSAELNAEHCE